ncbi:Protein sidekick-2 [Stylophora pistillata]|uniref:Protein sidekick-2 n=1 Tax=Stylophora pistillata TaxID=50429 RepID=A0A2B4STL4_STYPI|nr:Protein sidekick-2 [Stylophora pistillata]
MDRRLEPPSFTSQPMSAIVEEKENVTFMCSAHGDPIPNITWSRENGTLPVGRSLVTFDSLSLWNVLRNDSGNYTCTATSTAGTISSVAKLRVHSILEFTTDSSCGPYDIFIGDSLIISCSAESDLKPKMTWLLPNVSGVRILENNTLFITSAALSHAGTYTCQAENDLVILEGFIDVYVHAHLSCHHIKIQQQLLSGGNHKDTSGVYFIDSDGEDIGEGPFQVFCNMTMVNGTGATLLSHESENRTLVDGFGPSGSYRTRHKLHWSTLCPKL